MSYIKIVSAKKNDSDSLEFLEFVQSEFNTFFSEFSHHFNIFRFSYKEHAFDYLKYLFKLEKKTVNCQNISDHISSLNQQSINHFINSDCWSFRNLMDEVALESSILFENQKEQTALLIDEVGFRKKGKMSACVGRQYLGCIGKTDNRQVAVAAGLSQGNNYAPIDLRLFMHKEWESDTMRKKKCNIPEDQKHSSKPEMALKMIKETLTKGIKFDFVNFDTLYGNATFLLDYLVDSNIDFIGDVRSDY